MTANLATLGDCILAGVEESGTIQFECGYLSPYFITDPESMEVAFENPYVLIHENKVSSRKDLLSLLEPIKGCGKPLLIIAEDVEGEALATLVVNKLCGPLQVAAVRAPGSGDQRRRMLQDIARLTGGKAISEDIDVQLNNIQISDLGQAKKITIAKNNTVIEGRAKYDQLSFASDFRAQPSAHPSPLQSSTDPNHTGDSWNTFGLSIRRID